MLDLIYMVGVFGTFVLGFVLMYRLVPFVLTLLFGSVYKIKRVDSAGNVYWERKRITSQDELKDWLLKDGLSE